MDDSAVVEDGYGAGGERMVDSSVDDGTGEYTSDMYVISTHAYGRHDVALSLSTCMGTYRPMRAAAFKGRYIYQKCQGVIPDETKMYWSDTLPETTGWWIGDEVDGDDVMMFSKSTSLEPPPCGWESVDAYGRMKHDVHAICIPIVAEQQRLIVAMTKSVEIMSTKLIDSKTEVAALKRELDEERQRKSPAKAARVSAPPWHGSVAQSMPVGSHGPHVPKLVPPRVMGPQGSASSSTAVPSTPTGPKPTRKRSERPRQAAGRKIQALRLIDMLVAGDVEAVTEAMAEATANRARQPLHRDPREKRD
jgi:hypothetical protein